jgi:hypothetical protein
MAPIYGIKRVLKIILCLVSLESINAFEQAPAKQLLLMLK